MTLTGRFPRRHLRPDEVVSVAESLGGVADGVEPHLLECAECRESVETIRNTIGEFRSDMDDTKRRADFVDWNVFQASVRERLLARSVRRDSWIRRWTGIPLAPGPATAWAVAVLVVVSVFAWDGFRSPAAEPPVAGTADTASPESWFMIEEPDALEVEAIAWAGTDIFSTIDELDAGEEEVLRALLLEAANAEDSGSIR